MTRKLQVGDIIELKPGHQVYADVPESAVYCNKEGAHDLVHHDVRIGSPGHIFSELAGLYAVIETAYDGGTSGRWPSPDPYPDGYHVMCQKLDSDIRVDFYQTGCFTAMIECIEPIGRAKVSTRISDLQLGSVDY